MPKLLMYGGDECGCGVVDKQESSEYRWGQKEAYQD